MDARSARPSGDSQSPAPNKSGKRHFGKIAFVIIALLVLGGLVYFFMGSSFGKDGTNGAAQNQLQKSSDNLQTQLDIAASLNNDQDLRAIDAEYQQ